MGDLGPFGRMLIVMGLILVGVGALFLLAGKLPGIGRLPGDIYIRRGNFTFYFPLMTSILISIILSLIFGVLLRR
ncbi:MAG TPA: DUF2905 domain-containing protein [Firmicutes bacterium]|nr:DUF2905 domain-containing protein [Bacillota bacterium]